MSEGGSALRELLIQFGIGVDTSELKKGEKESEGFVGSLKRIATVAAEAFAIREVKEFVESQIEAGAQLKVTADRLGTTTDELQAMRLAAGEAGVSVEAMDTGLRFLNRNLANAAHGGEQAAIFQQLGISLKDASGEAKPAGDVMGELAEKISKLPSASEKTRIAMDLLGRGGAELIPLLNKGGAAFEEARKDMEALGGGLSEEFVEQAHKAEEAQVRLKFAMTGLSSTVVTALLPDVMKLVGGITSLIKSATEVERRSRILEDALGGLKVVAVAGAVIGLVKALQSLATAEGIVAALNPFTLFVVGGALALLAFNDLKVALEGGKSVFGGYFGQTGIETLKDDLDDANDALDRMSEVLKTIYAMFATAGNAAGSIVNQVAEIAHNLNASLVDKISVVTGEDVSNRVSDERGQAAEAAARAASYEADLDKNISDIGGGWRSAPIGTRRAKRHTAQAEAATLHSPLADENSYYGSPTFNAVTGQYDNGPALPNSYASYNAPALPAASPALSGRENGPPIVIHQMINNDIDVHGAATNEGTGKAVAGAVSTATQRANANALAAVNRP